jgi:hypothetical protein
MKKGRKITIEKVPLPHGSIIARLPFTDHADAFRTRVDPATYPDVDAFARVFLSSQPPGWVRAAMKTRDAVVGTLFGLKTVPADEELTGDLLHERVFDFVPGARFGIFRFLERSDNEIVFGEDDAHLDFRVSLFHERIGDDVFVTTSTVVRFNNALGRAYFLPVRPVHGLVVPAMIRRALDQASVRSVGHGSTSSSKIA